MPINIDNGMANPTNIEFLIPRKNNKTRITNIIPEIMLFSRLETRLRVWILWSLKMVTSMSSGKTFFFAIIGNLILLDSN